MDMEKLNKSQLILLGVLVSFITSIATGIVTVSLMDQAPPAITQTIERVVEKTVAQVTPTSQGAAAITTEKTTVKESDLIPQAVGRISPSIVRIYSGPAEAPEFAELGLVISKTGMILTDLAALPPPGSPLYIDNGGDKLLPASVMTRNDARSLALIQSATTTASGGVAYKPASFASDVPQLGARVITLSGRNSTRVSEGIVATIFSSNPTTSDGQRDVIDTSIVESGIQHGGVLVNTDGQVLGISTYASRVITTSGFLTSAAALNYISAAK